VSTAQPYYFRDTEAGASAGTTPGNDLNDGFTPATAKRTYQNVVSTMWNSLPAGTNLYFARGYAWTQGPFARMTNLNSHSVVTSITRSGTTLTATLSKRTNLEANDFVTFIGANEAEFNGYVQLTAVSDVGPFTVSWAENTGSAASATTNDKLRFDGALITVREYIETGANAPAIDAKPYCTYTDNGANSNRQHTFDNGAHLEGVQFLDISYKFTGTPGLGVPGCFFLASNTRDTFLFENLIIDGYRIGINPNGDLGPQTYINVKNCTIQNNWGQGVLGMFSNSVFDNVIFINNGHNNGNGSNQFNHNIYFSNRADMIDTTVKFCNLYQSALNAAGEAAGSSFSTHGVTHNLTVEDTLIYEDIGKCTSGSWGMSIAPGYTDYAEEYVNTKLRRLKIINTGNRDIDLAGWVGGTIENIVIINNQTAFTSVATIECRAAGIAGPQGRENQNISIKNCSLFGSNLRRAFRLEFGTGFNCVSNIAHYTGASNFDMFQCVLTITDNNAYANIDNNLAYAPNAAQFNWESTRGNLAAWQTASGNRFDVNSIEGQDPLYVDPANANPITPDLSLQAGSPAIGLGHPTLSSQTDFNNKSRGSNPDMGAYQFSLNIQIARMKSGIINNKYSLNSGCNFRK